MWSLSPRIWAAWVSAAATLGFAASSTCLAQGPELDFDFYNEAEMRWMLRGVPLTDSSSVKLARSLILADSGRFQEAQELSRAVLREVEASFGPNSLEAAQAIDVLIWPLPWILRTESERLEALRLAERAVTIKTRVFGPDHPETAWSLLRVGWIHESLSDHYRRSGDGPAYRTALNRAKQIYERTLAIFEGALSPDDPDLAGNLANLADIARKTSPPDLAQARVLMERTRGIGVLTGDTNPDLAPVTGENLLVLSGLALAGANHRAAAAEGEEDGILTAEEIAALDLSGVEWAVLSACDTGVGEVRAGEGVFGLRRAFEVAGAGTLVMSLWAVEDEATSAWMHALYAGRFVEGMETPAAVRAANLAVLRERRARGESTHPFYWAGFVAAGDWR